MEFHLKCACGVQIQEQNEPAVRKEILLENVLTAGDNQ